MIVTYFGHAAVGLTAERTPRPGFRLLVDPYEPGGLGGRINYPAIAPRFTPDLIAVSHEHGDHNYTAPWPEVEVIRAGQQPKQPLEVNWLDCAHDAFDGTTRGGRTGVLRVNLDGVQIVHSGDLGELPPPHELDALRPCDLILVSCGGYFTLGPAEASELALRLGACAVVPMHFATPQCGLAQLAGAADMTRHLPVCERRDGSWRYRSRHVAGLVLISPDAV